MGWDRAGGAGQARWGGQGGAGQSGGQGGSGQGRVGQSQGSNCLYSSIWGSAKKMGWVFFSQCCGWGGGYSDFCLLQGLELFFGFKILNFAIFLGVEVLSTIFMGMTI